MPPTHSKQKASWRDSRGPQRGQPKASVRGKRIVATTIAAVTVAGLLGLVFYLFSLQDKRTFVVWLGSSPSISGTLPPLGFNLETREAYQQVASNKKLLMAFEPGRNTESFAQQIRNSIKANLKQPKDVLIVAIRQHGIALDGKPLLVMNPYLLPDDIASQKDLVPFEDLLKAASTHPGSTLFLLDWGSVIHEPRLGVGKNLFINALQDLVKSSPQYSKIWILASHSNYQVSHDQRLIAPATSSSTDVVTPKSNTLFHQACAEALLAQRRLGMEPPKFMVDDPENHYLTLASVAEYVTSRVIRDSNGEQTPMLMQGGRGVVQIVNEELDEARSLHLVTIDHRTGRPVGLPKLKVESEDAAPTTAASKMATDAAGVTTYPEVSPADELWELLAEWSQPNKSLANWSTSEILPGATKELAAHALRLEHRFLAGKEYALDQVTNSTRLEIADAVTAIKDLARKAEQNAHQQFRSQPSISQLLVSTEERSADDRLWKEQVDSLKSYRKLSIRLNEAAKLCLHFDTLNSGSLADSLRGNVSQSISAIQEWYRSWNASKESISSTAPPVNWSQFTDQFERRVTELDSSVTGLISSAKKSKSSPRMLCKVLLRSPLLTLEQRRQLQAEYQTLTPAKDLLLTDLKIEIAPLVNTPADEQMSLVYDKNLLAQIGQFEFDQGLVARASKLLRDELRSSPNPTELAWLLLDGRDFIDGVYRFSDPSPNYVSSQLPAIPPRPEEDAKWVLAVVDAQTDQPFSNQRLRFTEATDAKQIKVKLTRRGRPSKITAMNIELKNLQGRLGDSLAKPVRNTIRLSEAEWMQLENINGDEHYLLLELKPYPNRTANQRLVARFEVEFDNVPAQEYVLDVSVKEDRPVELLVEESLLREEEAAWEVAPVLGSVVTQRPFPKRDNPVRFKFRSTDDEDLSITMELFALPDPRLPRPAGRLATADGGILEGVEGLVESTLLSIAKTEAVRLPARQTVDAIFSTPAPNLAAAPAPTADDQTVKAIDINYGMLAVIRDQNSNRVWRTWLQLIPRGAPEYLIVDSDVQENGTKVAMEVRLRDDNQNGLADILPSDFSMEKGIALEWVTWPWQTRDLTEIKRMGSLDTVKRTATFGAVSADGFPRTIQLLLSVDGNPRALIYQLDTQGIQKAKEMNDVVEGYLVQRVEQLLPEKGLVYDRDQLSLPQANGYDLDEMDASFPGRVEDKIKMVLNLDSQSESTSPNLFPRKYIFAESLADERVLYGDRSVQFGIRRVTNQEFHIDCQVSDWEFVFNFRGAEALDEPLTLSGEKLELTKPANFVLDGISPKVTDFKRWADKPIYAGNKIPISFKVEDRSPIRSVQVSMKQVGGTSQVTKPPQVQVLPATNRKLYANRYSIDLSAEEPVVGKSYEITITAVDQVGNVTTYEVDKLLKVLSEPTPVTPSGASPGTTPMPVIKGTIRGVVQLGTSGRAHTNSNSENKVTIKELDKTVDLKDGTFEFQEIEAGKYTIVAKVKDRGIDYVGEKPIDVTTAEKFKQEFVVAVKKPE